MRHHYTCTTTTPSPPLHLHNLYTCIIPTLASTTIPASSLHLHHHYTCITTITIGIGTCSSCVLFTLRDVIIPTKPNGSQLPLLNVASWCSNSRFRNNSASVTLTVIISFHISLTLIEHIADAVVPKLPNRNSNRTPCEGVDVYL